MYDNRAMSKSAATQAVIDQCKQRLESCTNRFLATFSHVPDDRLNWSPSETAKTPLQMAAHAALSNFAFAMFIKMEPLTNMPGPEERKKRESEIDSREKLQAVLAESTKAALAAMDTVTDETIGMDVPSPFFTAPMPFWMDLPSRHIDNHAAQIDYIQTIYGDMEWHMA
jgi:hypothetical protein